MPGNWLEMQNLRRLPRPTKSEPAFEQNPQVIFVHISLRSIGSDYTEKTLVSKVEHMIEAGVFG